MILYVSEGHIQLNMTKDCLDSLLPGYYNKQPGQELIRDMTGCKHSAAPPPHLVTWAPLYSTCQGVEAAAMTRPALLCLLCLGGLGGQVSSRYQLLSKVPCTGFYMYRISEAICS